MQKRRLHARRPCLLVAKIIACLRLLDHPSDPKALRLQTNASIISDISALVGGRYLFSGSKYVHAVTAGTRA
jgi:hypothetical protein